MTIFAQDEREEGRGEVVSSMNCAQAPLFAPIPGYSASEGIARWEERQRERVRIARELHDSLFQGFISASMVLHRAVQETPWDSPGRSSLTRALSMMQRVIDEGRLTLQGLRSAPVPTRLEEKLAGLREELVLDSGVELRIVVSGRPKSSDPDVCEQLHLIAREAVANAIRHSKGTEIEIEVEYTTRATRLAVRDNGCGMDKRAVGREQSGHWGLLGMRERAESIGGRFRMWSRPGAGTEVEISVEQRQIGRHVSRPVT